MPHPRDALRALVDRWRATAYAERRARMRPEISDYAREWEKGHARGLEDAADDLERFVGPPPNEDDDEGP